MQISEIEKKKDKRGHGKNRILKILPLHTYKNGLKKKKHPTIPSLKEDADQLDILDFVGETLK